MPFQGPRPIYRDLLIMNDLPPCDWAQVQLWQDASGDWWETFRFPPAAVPNAPSIDNEIIRPSAATQTPAAQVMADRGLCRTVATVATAAPADIPSNATSAAPGVDGGSGAFLLVIALAGSAAYAYFQQQNNRADFAGDYHPMDDAPMLPMVATDENLDILYGRVGHPQYQGVTAANPWQSAPVATGGTTGGTSIPLVEATDFSTGGDGVVVISEQEFWDVWSPVPRAGYELSEESVIGRHTQAKRIVRDAMRAGISGNKLCDRIFKVSKNSRGHQLLMQVIAAVESEVSHV